MEIIPGSLLAAERIVPGTLQHSDEIANECRIKFEIDPVLREQGFYTADGNLYACQNKNLLLGFTRGPQNLILTHLRTAYQELIRTNNFFPDPLEAKAALEHKDTWVVDLNGLRLVLDCKEYGHLVIEPKYPGKLNSQERAAAKRLYGPDEESFGLNLELFVKTGIKPLIFFLQPEYVQRVLGSTKREYLLRASWRNGFFYNHDSNAIVRNVDIQGSLRGVPLR